MVVRLWLTLALLALAGCMTRARIGTEPRRMATSGHTAAPRLPTFGKPPEPPPPLTATVVLPPPNAASKPRPASRRSHAAPIATIALRPASPEPTYCAILDRPASPDECAQASNPDRFSTEGRASLSRPRQMYRGQVARVRFAVVQGADQLAADIAARTGATGDTTDIVGRVRYARRMEARLTGQGFEITPITPASIDTGGGGEAAWEWRIRPTRSNAHYLQVEAWVLKPDGSRGPPIRYPTYAVEVPVRWWPDRVQDFSSDSIGWFGQGTSWLKALAALMAAAAAAWAAWKKLRPARPQTSSTVAP